MWVSKEFKICASHIIPNHPGRCRNLHGHNWRIVVSVNGDKDPGTGMVMDFAVLKKAVEPIVMRWDHQHLNYHILLPTAENIAIRLAHDCWPILGVIPKVLINETDNSEAIFDPEIDSEREFHAAPGNKKLWQSPLEGIIPVFRDMKARAVWYSRQMDEEQKLLAKLHKVGSRIANFKQYKDSLDENEAKHLLDELEQIKEQQTKNE
ncbi:MAG: 6-carboxytetrahydropterin synthase QueD [Patescibacteria group bacterium]|nr:6-carboxytetrahydropterin synthase QueD [Patescibacteria group bacterium]